MDAYEVSNLRFQLRDIERRIHEINEAASYDRREAHGQIYFARYDKSIKMPKKNKNGYYNLYAHFKNDFVIPSCTKTEIPFGLYSRFYSTHISIFGTKEAENIGLIIQGTMVDCRSREEWCVTAWNANKKDIIITNSVTRITERENKILFPTDMPVAYFKTTDCYDVFIDWENILALQSE